MMEATTQSIKARQTIEFWKTENGQHRLVARSLEAFVDAQLLEIFLEHLLVLRPTASSVAPIAVDRYHSTHAERVQDTLHPIHRSCPSESTLFALHVAQVSFLTWTLRASSFVESFGGTKFGHRPRESLEARVVWPAASRGETVKVKRLPLLLRQGPRLVRLLSLSVIGSLFGST